ncbi:Na+/H+ antiporter subunit D [Georgenia sp. Z1491]|uniref:Na+/H+ antiporter subunit D n=1 Tax=Georgenia sp. Z1491 TaxID=3416707 RepID=UPI003CEEBB27
MSWLLAVPVLLPLLGAGTSLMLARFRRAQGIISVVVLAAVLAVAIVLLVAVDSGPIVLNIGGWSAPVGIVLVADRLSALLLVVSVAVTLAVLVYSFAQNVADGDEGAPVTIYHPTFLVLSAGVSNAFLAGDLFNLYVGFEMLLVASFVLITLGGTRDRIRSGTVYIIVSFISSFIFLAGIAYVYAAAGTVNMAQLAQRLPEIDPSVTVVLEAVLLIAFGIKAALFPLSAWLPDSYPTAPAPVTAVFAGLLTKVGVYAIIRSQVTLFGDSRMSTVLLVVAAAAMIVGILGAVAQADLKRLLSFTLISHIGYMIWGIGTATTDGLSAAIFYVAHHITVQTGLFLVAGLIERRGGTTSLVRLGSLARLAPLLAVLYLVPALNLAGIPPFSGFLGKVGLMQAAATEGSWMSWTLVGAGLVTSLLTLYAVVKAWNMAFWQEAPEELEGQSTPATMTLSAGAVIAMSLGMTVAAGPIVDYADTAARDLMLRTPYIAAVLPGGERGDGISDEIAERGERSEEMPVETPSEDQPVGEEGVP